MKLNSAFVYHPSSGETNDTTGSELTTVNSSSTKLELPLASTTVKFHFIKLPCVEFILKVTLCSVSFSANSVTFIVLIFEKVYYEKF